MYQRPLLYKDEMEIPGKWVVSPYSTKKLKARSVYIQARTPEGAKKAGKAWLKTLYKRNLDVYVRPMTNKDIK